MSQGVPTQTRARGRAFLDSEKPGQPFSLSVSQGRGGDHDLKGPARGILPFRCRLHDRIALEILQGPCMGTSPVESLDVAIDPAHAAGGGIERIS
jgi:hypothetical protein